jgi:hypothetical protein
MLMKKIYKKKRACVIPARALASFLDRMAVSCHVKSLVPCTAEILLGYVRSVLLKTACAHTNMQEQHAKSEGRVDETHGNFIAGTDIYVASVIISGSGTMWDTNTHEQKHCGFMETSSIWSISLHERFVCECVSL